MRSGMDTPHASNAPEIFQNTCMKTETTIIVTFSCKMIVYSINWTFYVHVLVNKKANK